MNKNQENRQIGKIVCIRSYLDSSERRKDDLSALKNCTLLVTGANSFGNPAGENIPFARCFRQPVIVRSLLCGDLASLQNEIASLAPAMTARMPLGRGHDRKIFHPDLSDPSLRSSAPDASATGVNPHSLHTIVPRFLT